MAASTRAARVVDWSLRSDFFEARRFGASSDMWFEDEDRAKRCHDAAEYGADGSTHYEAIQDMRSSWSDFVNYGDRDHRRNPYSLGKDRIDRAVCAHFDDVEAWHEKNGTLHEEIG